MKPVEQFFGQHLIRNIAYTGAMFCRKAAGVHQWRFMQWTVGCPTSAETLRTRRPAAPSDRRARDRHYPGSELTSPASPAEGGIGAISQKANRARSWHDQIMQSSLPVQDADVMCIAHLTDPYLAKRVSDEQGAGSCMVCPATELSPEGPVIPVSALGEVIADFAERCFDHEGLVVDSSQVFDPVDPESLISTLLEDAVDVRVLDYVSAILTEYLPDDQDWFEPFDMDLEDQLEYEWTRFDERVKHESRLLSPPQGERAVSAPEHNYEFVRSLLVFAEDRAGLIRELPKGSKLYRARISRDARALEREARESPATVLGPAPLDRVSAGRMNAQGVAMFYVAEDAETASAEVASHSPYDEAVVGTFILQQPLRVLDLTRVPPRRSLFDDARDDGDDRLASLSFYRDRITRPVILDDQHPVDYAASQLITEAFRWWTDPPLDGIAYPSRVRAGGVNLVLFFGDPKWFETEGVPASRFSRFERQQLRGTGAALFKIAVKTIRRFRVQRSISIERSRF